LGPATLKRNGRLGVGEEGSEPDRRGNERGGRDCKCPGRSGRRPRTTGPVRERGGTDLASKSRRGKLNYLLTARREPGEGSKKGCSREGCPGGKASDQTGVGGERETIRLL